MTGKEDVRLVIISFMSKAGISVCMHWRYLVWGVEFCYTQFRQFVFVVQAGGGEALREQEAFPLCNGTCCTWIGSDDGLVQ